MNAAASAMSVSAGNMMRAICTVSASCFGSDVYFSAAKLRISGSMNTMPSTAENVADEFSISREDQDRFAQLSQEKAKAGPREKNEKQ